MDKSLTQKYKKEYVIWNKLLNACTKKDSKNYHLFGGQGYTIDKNWLNFKTFIDEMGEITKKNDGIKIVGDSREFNKYNSTYCKIKKGRKAESKSESFKSKKERLKKSVSFTLSLSEDLYKYIKKQALSRSVIEGEAYNSNDLLREVIAKAFPLPKQLDIFGDKLKK